MANKLILKNGAGIPAPEKLEVAELALDTEDGALYSKLADGSVVQLNDGADDVDLSDYVTEAPVDTKQYARQDGDWSEIVIPDGGTGSSVHIGESEPTDPQEGQQWMEVPASGEATMWIYDGGKWLQHPSGKDGAAGADGNIADATTEGVVATWDDTAKQWTPDSSLTIDSSGKATFSGAVSSGDLVSAPSGFQIRNSNGDQTARLSRSDDAVTQLKVTPDNQSHSSYFQFKTVSASSSFFGTTGSSLKIGTGVDRETTGFVLDNSGDATFSGRVSDSTGPLMSSRHLIKTLSTLRNATKDETTIKGLRDAIGNAVGGLIEKFEAMQSAATQEIDDE